MESRKRVMGFTAGKVVTIEEMRREERRAILGLREDFRELPRCVKGMQLITPRRRAAGALPVEKISARATNSRAREGGPALRV